MNASVLRCNMVGAAFPATWAWLFADVQGRFTQLVKEPGMESDWVLPRARNDAAACTTQRRFSNLNTLFSHQCLSQADAEGSLLAALHIDIAHVASWSSCSSTDWPQPYTLLKSLVVWLGAHASPSCRPDSTMPGMEPSAGGVCEASHFVCCPSQPL